MGFVGGGGNIVIATALPPSFFCVLYYKHQTAYGIFLSNFFRLLEASVSGREDLTLARGVLFLLSTEYSVVMCDVWSGIFVT